MSNAHILIAGIGNVLMGDDGFGVEVAARLATRRLPDGVVAADIGMRSLHLTFALLDKPDCCWSWTRSIGASRPGRCSSSSRSWTAMARRSWTHTA